MISVYAGANPTHDLVLRAFFDGCPEEKEWRSPEDYSPSEVAVVFGVGKKAIPASWPRGVVVNGQKRSGGKVIVIDSGYVRRGSGEENYFACGFGGLNGWADFRNKDMPPDRWAALDVPIRDWQQGNNIILCGQVPWDASVQHIDIIAWLEKTARRLKILTDRPIIYRPHPLAVKHSPETIEGCETSCSSLEDDLRNAWAVVTYNSNSGVDAILNGVPNFCLGGGSMTNGVCNQSLQDIEGPIFPPRKQWAWNLAYTQWTPEEMRAGKTWAHLYGG